MKLSLVKHGKLVLMPLEGESTDYVLGIREGEVIHAEFSQMRNGKFFRKWWALINYAYEHWEPQEVKGNDSRFTPEKNLETFRKHITVLAGHYDAHYGINGSVRIEARSISWAKMSESEFKAFYSATVDVILKHILSDYSRQDIDMVIDELLGFL